MLAAGSLLEAQPHFLEDVTYAGQGENVMIACHHKPQAAPAMARLRDVPQLVQSTAERNFPEDTGLMRLNGWAAELDATQIVVEMACRA